MAADDSERLRAALNARLQQLGLSPDDPRAGAMLAQVQALMQQGLAVVGATGNIVPLRAPPPAPMPVAQLEGLSPPLGDLVEAHIRDAHGQTPQPMLAWYAQAPSLSASESGRRLLELAPADKARVAVAAYAAWTSESHGGQDGAVLRRIVSDLMRSKLDFDEAQVLRLVKAAVRQGFDHSSYSPNLAVATALKRHVEAQGLSLSLRDALSGLRARMTHGSAERSSEGRKLLTVVDAMLAHRGDAASDEPRFEPKRDAWGTAISAKIAAQPRLTRLLALAAKGGENAKPAKGWLKAAESELAAADRDELGPLLLDIIECHEPGVSIALENQNTLRALIWLAALAAPAAAARRLEAYAQKCLTFSPAHFAYLSLVLGNAAVHAFSLMPGTAGVGSLARLKRRLKRPGEIKTVDKALAALAAARGMTAGELEEIGLPDYGFGADQTLQIAVGPATAVLAITDESALSTTWRGADGRSLSGPPTAVKEAHGEALKALKGQVKEIGETLKAQRLRLERLYLDGREWPLEVWRARYLDEPLLAHLSRRLIWSFLVDGQWVPGLADAEEIADASGNRLEATRVKLWHPMQSDVASVLAWRQRLTALGITQPFKQAHREIYVLTDAERATNVYSNRFAGHIVEQHRFRALCQARGWACPTFGAWDPGNGRPMKRLPERGLQVEFWVDPVEPSMGGENFQFQHLATDQVRFATPGGEPITLAAVDPVIFSELMRDADLFVGVASIGNDPTWADRGDERFAEYWVRSAFGELTESGKSRHAALADILPGLAIAARCRLEERYLVVEGRLRSYRIHLGSANIQMEPNNQYLCIVQDRANSGSQVRLPFEGDATLALILSKAFLLADDDKIKDPSIRSQIMHGLAAR